VPIPTVHSRTLSKVLEYCNKHVAEAEVAPPANGEADADPAADSSAADKSLEEWDKVSSCVASGCTLCKTHVRPLAHLACYLLSVSVVPEHPNLLMATP